MESGKLEPIARSGLANELLEAREPTKDMQTILDFLKEFEIGSVLEISFCTLIEEWRVEIDLQDMADEGWIELSTNDEGHTLARIINQP